MYGFVKGIIPEVAGVVGIAPIAVVFPSYLRRRAAFHFAQRARWAAAIRLRAAVDIGLRFFGSRIPLDFPPTPPRLPKAANAAFSCCITPCTRSLSFRNCWTTPFRFSMVPLGRALYQRVRTQWIRDPIPEAQTTGTCGGTLRRGTGIYSDSPLLEKPFWDIAPIPILLTPGAEFGRRAIHLGREPQ
jgi:hypothetical protein